MGNYSLQTWSEPLDLYPPVRHQRGRRDQQAGAPISVCDVAPLALENDQKRDQLDGLAETHIVGEACTEPELGQQVQPLQAGELVGPQRRVERGAWIDSCGRVAAPGRQ